MIGGKQFSRCFTVIALALSPLAVVAAADRPAPPDYATSVSPLFRKYCLGCHNGQEAQGGLVLETHAQAMHGGEHGAVILPRNADKSRLILALEKKIDPAMPPEGNRGPTAAEIAVLRAWINAGAKPSKQNAGDREGIVAPKIEPIGKPRNPIDSLAYSPDGKSIAAGRYGVVAILSSDGQKVLRTLSGHSGSVNDVGYSNDGKLLFAAAGQPGLYGELSLWDTSTWVRKRTIRAHRDALLAADLSSNGRTLATASYDQTIRLWDLASGRELRTLTGHNGPVFDVAFDPAGRLLASASGDRTVKLWSVATGERLDTFSQPTKDQYAVAFSRDGKLVIAGGVDSRLRFWRISQTAKEGTNEVVESLFAHDGPVIRLATSPDGRWIASSSEDRTIKIWDMASFRQLEKLANQSDWTTALAVAPNGRSLAAGRLDGTLAIQPISQPDREASEMAQPVDYAPLPRHLDVSSPSRPSENNSTSTAARRETEPNDSPKTAMPLALPARVRGVLNRTASGGDFDYFRFHAKAGQTWILETRAAADKSPADTRLDVFHADGSPVLRCLLRAIRDSAITFRPIDSRQEGARLENWQEMELDQFVYMSGEVCRLFRAPRGPDSEYGYYSLGGGRRCYFDTSAVGHALNEPVYIVEPYAPGTQLPDNGLPIFPVYYSNDDDSSRKGGRDSRLTFTADQDGDYLVRVSEVRGAGGPDFSYSLSIREPRPGFRVSLHPDKLTIPAGGGQRFVVAADRIDNFEGEIRVELSGAPAGFHISTPLVIEKGLVEAVGTIHADPRAKQPAPETWKSLQVTATAQIGDRKVSRKIVPFRELHLGPSPKVAVRLIPETSGDAPSDAGTIEIEPGQTVTAMLEITRNGFNGELRFDVENLPHGVIVDNIGLNGIMIRAGETRRQVFLTASKKLSPTQRLIHAFAGGEGNPSSPPVLLRVTGRLQ